MEVTYHGHATFHLTLGAHSIILDPFLSGNEKAVAGPENISCTHMLLSHGHQDHVLDAVAIAERTGCQVISNYEIVTWLGEQGISNGQPMNHGGRVSTDFGSVKYVNAVHSSVLPDGTYGGNPGGFIIGHGGKEYYYAGDTALTLDMELLGRYHDLELAFLPIGDVFTMGVEDAVRAAKMVGVKTVIGMHFDTWPLLEIDHADAKARFASEGIELHLMDIGEKKTF